MKQMPRYFALADALLVTLKDEPIFNLTLPAKVQSYLACGRPIIAAVNGEGARIINEAKAGITCNAEEPKLLADAVLNIFQMQRDIREKLGSHGKTYYQKHFKRDVLLNQLEIWLQQQIVKEL
jgi:glycosyltransferase involved in cell wall biosynthesis